MSKNSMWGETGHLLCPVIHGGRTSPPSLEGHFDTPNLSEAAASVGLVSKQAREPEDGWQHEAGVQSFRDVQGFPDGGSSESLCAVSRLTWARLPLDTLVCLSL